MQGLPKAVVKKVETAWKKCETSNKLNQDCLEKEILSFAEVAPMENDPNIRDLEKNILEMGEKITASEMDQFYERIQRSGLSEDKKLVRYKEFEAKVKRAIQMEQFGKK